MGEAKHGEDTEADGKVCRELTECAGSGSKHPHTVPHEHKGRDAVKDDHDEIGYSKIDKESIRQASHVSVP